MAKAIDVAHACALLEDYIGVLGHGVPLPVGEAFMILQDTIPTQKGWRKWDESEHPIDWCPECGQDRKGEFGPSGGCPHCNC